VLLTELHWVPMAHARRLAVSARPRGGDWLEDQLSAWRAAGVHVVVSLLELEEEAELQLASESAIASANGIEFVRFPIADRAVPESHEAFAQLVAALAEQIRNGKSVAVHCRQGIGRAATLAVAILVRLGSEVTSAIAAVSAARGREVPETPEQRTFLAEFAERRVVEPPA
jgi:protein-tyrosine phosphatase